MQLTIICPSAPGWILNLTPILGELYAMQCALVCCYLVITLMRIRQHLPWRGYIVAFLVGDALFTAGFIFLSGVSVPTHQALSDWASRLILLGQCDTPGAQALVEQRDHMLEMLYFPAGLILILGAMMPALLAALSSTPSGQRYRWLRRG